MTVNPGWGGQPFIAGLARQGRGASPSSLPEALLEVDGGIDADDRRPRSPTPARRLFVAGSAIFGAADPGAAYREIADGGAERALGARRVELQRAARRRGAEGAGELLPPGPLGRLQARGGRPGGAHHSASWRRPPTASRSAPVTA